MIYFRVAWQLFREFWLALVVAVFLTIYGQHLTGEWATFELIATFWTTLVAVGWLIVQWVRVHGKFRTDDKLGDIATRLQTIVTDLRAATTDLGGHITGGASVSYVYGLPDNPQGEFSPRHRTKRFSCSVCGDEAWLTVTDPRTERGMGDYRLDQRKQPERHPRTVERLTGNRRQSSVDLTGGELPGRKADGRR